MTNDYVFLSIYKEDEQNTLIHEGLNNRIPLFLINKQDGYHQLSLSQLNDIYTAKPNQTEVTFHRATIVNGRTEDFGSWDYANINDILARKADAEKIVSEKQKPTEKILSEKERNTLQKMLLAMAIDKYEYNSKNERNIATGASRGSIKSAIEKHLNGGTIDEDTIRRYLQEASDKFLS